MFLKVAVKGLVKVNLTKTEMFLNIISMEFFTYMNFKFKKYVGCKPKSRKTEAIP